MKLKGDFLTRDEFKLKIFNWEVTPKYSGLNHGSKLLKIDSNIMKTQRFLNRT